MRVLGLPGWRTNAKVLNFQLSGLQAALKATKPEGVGRDPDYEIRCIDPAYPASGPPYESVSSFYGEEGPYFEWWDMQQPSENEYVFKGLEHAVESTLAFIRKEGPFDAVVGFSQGGALLSLLEERVEREPKLLPVHMRWKCSVFVGAVPVRDSAYRSMYSRKSLGSMCESLFLIGENDEYKRVLDKLHGFYAAAAPLTTTLIRYPEAHAPPTWRKSEEELRRAATCLRETSSPPIWWAFDFDGVLCHSARETCLSGLRAGAKLLPKEFTEENINGPIVEDLVTAFKVLRPVLEHGFHSIILCYMILRDWDRQGDVLNLAHKLEANLRKDGFGPILEELKAKGVEKSDLTEALHTARDQWIESDSKSWLAANEFYEEAVEAVRDLCSDPNQHVYIVTTKHKSFATALLAHIGLDIPEERVYGQGMGAKEVVLNDLAESEEAGKQCFFLEDRVGTLERVAVKLKHPTRLAFASWGYNEQVDTETALNEKFEVLQQADLQAVIAHELTKTAK
mmetsp:Transcript_5927/g.10594  ORF Transcript_5927/g.10594 Transcript_5927/m.10594 type:complete len:510 (+) Transcript_5927:236-1765(+)